MNRIVTKNGEVIEYELHIKSVKNINLRIRRDGSVTVSANRRVPLTKIENFIREKSEFILKAKEKYEDLGKSQEENTVKILGCDYYLAVKSGNVNKATLGEREVFLTLKDETDENSKKLALDRLYLRICEQIIPEICAKTYDNHFRAKKITYPQIKFRKMKSRWGSCSRKNKVLTFNTYLAKAPISCIESVVAHEFTHFLHFDHSPNFYSALLLIMPDYKERKKLLDNTVRIK